MNTTPSHTALSLPSSRSSNGFRNMSAAAAAADIEIVVPDLSESIPDAQVVEILKGI